jgi:glycosyltransferase involved in cell wall biosynthesis
MVNPIRILVATGLYPPESGGPATYTKLLEEALPEHGFEVSVLAFRTVRHLPPGVRHVAYFWKCYLRARRADIVFAQDTVSVGLPAALAAKLAAKKFVVRVPGDYAWEQGKQRFGVREDLDDFQHKQYGFFVGLLRAIQRFVVRSATKVIAPSKYLQSIVAQWGTNSTVVYNGIELSVSAEIPNQRPEGFLVVSMGRRVPWKGFEALERVCTKNNWQLFIAENLPRAQALGWVQSADVFVLNSTYEGLSHALLEVMALGTPIVATNVGGNPELLEDTGVLVPPNSDQALEDAIRRVQEDPAAARARAERAQSRVKEFAVDKTVARLAELLKTL